MSLPLLGPSRYAYLPPMNQIEDHPMNSLSPLLRQSRTQSLVAGAALLVCCGAAMAQTVSPFTFVAAQRFTKDSNVFRTTSNEQSDRISATTLGLNVDQPIGRQRLVARFGVTRNAYGTNDNLDNTSSNVLTRLLLATAEDLTGELALSQTNRLGDFAANTTEKNMERNRVISANAQLGASSLWVIEGGVAARDLAYSRTANAAAELKATSLNAGVRFNPSPASSIGLGVRKTSGEYKQSANEFDRRDVDVTLRWNPSDLSSFSARVSRTQDEAPGQRPERSLVTSAVGFQWQPTALLGFNLQVLRDTNEGVGTVGSTLESSSTYNGTITTAGQLTTTLELTAALNANLTFGTAKRDLTTNLADGSDSTRTVGLGLAYTPARWVTVQVGTKNERRTTDQGIQLFSVPYKATTSYIGAEFRLN